MSLPSGYTRLEWIQSSGTQYVNTGVKPNQGTRVMAEFSTTAASTSLFGAQEGWGTKSFSFGGNTASFGANASTALTLNDGVRHSVDLKSGGIVVDGNTLFTWDGTFQLNCNMFVLANNENNSTTYYSTATLYSCKIYDGGTLIRDFIPCKNASGTVGLWDAVNSQFYGNSGTGSFIAGPATLEPPAAPTNFQTILAAVLAWTPVEKAESYKLYRDGKLIGATTTTQYVDTTVEANETYVYSIKAVNTAGESAATSATVYTKTGYFEYKPMIQSANFP